MFWQRIPIAFVKRFKKIMPKTLILKSNVGKSALVSVKKNDQGYFFERGWLKFSRDHHLQVGEFLVFNFVGDRTFEVVIYDPSCCEKDMELAAAKGNKRSKTQVAIARPKKETPTEECDTGSPQFRKSLASHETTGELCFYISQQKSTLCKTFRI